jgi:putative glutamine amidotransferase
VRPLVGIPCQSNLRSPYRRHCVGQPYCRAVSVAGGAPVLIPALEDEGALLAAYERLDALLLAGGGDVEPHHFGQSRSARVSGVDRPRDKAELLLIRRAVGNGLPLLAICRGVQMLNVALGGTLYQDIAAQINPSLRHNFHPDHPRNYLGHAVDVASGSRLADIVGGGSIMVNSFHHQCVQDVAAGLCVAAVAPDGVVEALEAPGEAFVLGVQWHPEELVDDDPRMLRLFQALIAEASSGRHAARS